MIIVKVVTLMNCLLHYSNHVEEVKKKFREDNIKDEMSSLNFSFKWPFIRRTNRQEAERIVDEHFYEGSLHVIINQPKILASYRYDYNRFKSYIQLAEINGKGVVYLHNEDRWILEWNK